MRHLKPVLTAVVMTMYMAASASAAIKSRAVEYSTPDGSLMEGYISYDDGIKTPQPAIIIVPDWMGLGQFAKNKAQLLAKEGYVVFAADVYGKGIRPVNSDQAATLATKYKSDRPLLQSHIRAAYNTLTAMTTVDKGRVVVMGYCFGGTTALELARSGVPLAGTASFHGGLANPIPENAKNIKGAVLVMHGADDPLVPPAEVAGFKQEMDKAGIKYNFVAYPGAVHAFTNPAAGEDKSTGVAYNEAADRASWVEFERFLDQTIKPSL